MYRAWRSIRKSGFGVWRQFRMNLIDEDRYQMIFMGLGRTVLIAVSSALVGVVLGCVIALMRLSNAKIGKWKFLQSISSIYVDVIRGTPVVVQLMIMYYVILTSPNISKITVAIITFGLNSAAYVSEMVRGGILAVDKGQTEAGRSLGLSAGATMLLIVLPQTIKIIIPSLFNEIIMLLKETSVVGFIGLMDLTKAGDFIRSRTYSAFFPLLTVAAVYLIIVSALTRVFNRVERRLRQGDIR
ncbi:MAG: amino acid ABC transporter permease [Clostridia bacterium]|nr:amino acid ABC transporter permease [Clostridia bacterium]